MTHDFISYLADYLASAVSRQAWCSLLQDSLLLLGRRSYVSGVTLYKCPASRANTIKTRNDKAQAETIRSLALPAALLLTVDVR